MPLPLSSNSWPKTAHILDSFLRHELKTPIDLQAQLSSDPSYISYLRAALFFVRQFSTFGVAGDQLHALQVSSLFFVWLKAVDNEIDHQKTSPEVYLALLQDPQPPALTTAAPASALTLALAKVAQTGSPEFMQELSALARTVGSEKEAQSMTDLIKLRALSGRLTAQCLCSLLEPQIVFTQRFRECFARLGAVGNISDSAIDLELDLKAGVVNFPVRTGDRLLLYATALRGIVDLVRHYPELDGELLGTANRLFQCYWDNKVHTR